MTIYFSETSRQAHKSDVRGNVREYYYDLPFVVQNKFYLAHVRTVLYSYNHTVNKSTCTSRYGSTYGPF